MRLAHDTWVVIADGEKYLLLRNSGDADILNLEVVAHETSKNAAARDLATDRPGRRLDSVSAGSGGAHASGRSAMEETDWHRVAEKEFAKGLADRLRDLHSGKRFSHVVIVADPRTLGELRKRCGDALREAIVAEIGKDLTGAPVGKMEQVILDYSPAGG